LKPDAERIARNQAAFREANEQIDAAAQGVALELIPFLCECAEPSCTELLKLGLDEYRDVRENPRRFVMSPGHEASADGWAEVVDRNARFVVAEKVGEAGELAEELDETLVEEEA
jgi:hypothetical protein